MIVLIKLNYKLVNLFLAIASFFLILKLIPESIGLFEYISPIITPILISFLISYMLYLIYKFLPNKINKNIKILIVLFILLIVTIVFIFKLIPILKKELTFLADMISYITKNIPKRINVSNNISMYLEKSLSNISNNIYKITSDVILKSINTIKTVIFVITLSIFIFIGMDQIKEKLYLLLKKTKYECLIKNILLDISKYFKSLGIIMIIEFVEYTFVFFIIGHENYLLLGLLMSISSLIPYLGNTIVNILSILFSLRISRICFILTVTATLLLPILDAYVVDPKIIKSTLKINPIKIILVSILLNLIFGAVGFILAVPTIIIIENILSYKNVI